MTKYFILIIHLIFIHRFKQNPFIYLGYQGNPQEQVSNTYSIGHGTRMLNQKLRRFLSYDAIYSPFQAGGLHGFVYAINNPYLKDSSGHMPKRSEHPPETNDEYTKRPRLENTTPDDSGHIPSEDEQKMFVQRLETANLDIYLSNPSSKEEINAIKLEIIEESGPYLGYKKPPMYIIKKLSNNSNIKVYPLHNLDAHLFEHHPPLLRSIIKEYLGVDALSIMDAIRKASSQERIKGIIRNIYHQTETKILGYRGFRFQEVTKFAKSNKITTFFYMGTEELPYENVKNRHNVLHKAGRGCQFTNPIDKNETIVCL